MTRSGHVRSTCFLGILVLTAAAVVAAEATVAKAGEPVAAPEQGTPADGAALLQRLQAELDTDRYAEALLTARAATAVFADNQNLWYNLAGLEEWHGDRAAAIEAMRRAVEAGFDDFRFADEDDDLGGLRRDPAYRALRDDWAADLARAAQARALTLITGEWSEPIALQDLRGAVLPPEATVRLRADQRALEVELLVTHHEPTPLPPWLGGSGVVLAVVLPATTGGHESQRHVEFAFGMHDKSPRGAVSLRQGWRPLPELALKVRPTAIAAQWQWNITIPWSIGSSLHPLIDDTLGLNVTYQRRGGDLPAATAAWLADPATGRPQQPWRRAVPVTWRWPHDGGPQIHGRLADSVVRDDTVHLAPLVVVTPSDEPAQVQLVLRDHTGRIRQQATWSIDGPAGRRVFRSALPLGDAAPGPARLGATYQATPTADAVAWETELVILPPGWEDRTSARVATAPAREQPSLQHRLRVVKDLLARYDPLADVDELGSLVGDLQDLLAHLDAHGTSLPAGGTYLAVMPAVSGQPQVGCSLSLPVGWRHGDDGRVLLLLVRSQGGEQRAVAAAPRFLAEQTAHSAPHGTGAILAIAHLGELADGEISTELAGALLVWLRDFLGCGPVYLAGVDLLAATVLEVAAVRRADLAGVMMVTGMNFVPYPADDADALRARVANLDPSLPASWIWFPDEQQAGDQAAALRRALRAAGLRLQPARAVEGGMNLSQAWTRALLWTLQQDP